MRDGLDEGDGKLGESRSPRGFVPIAPTQPRPPEIPRPSRLLKKLYKGWKRGEVVLKTNDRVGDAERATILQHIVVVHGVISVTFEDVYIIVTTKTPTIASDRGFLLDLWKSLSDTPIGETLKHIGILQRQRDTNALGTHAGVLQQYGDAQPLRKLLERESPFDGSSLNELQCSAKRFGYLDDESDSASCSDAGSQASALGSIHYSFFNQFYWMELRRIQEHVQDPTLSARLSRIKERESESSTHQSSRFRRFMGALQLVGE